ncbi:MAG: nuclear transport factor 2 family protein [Bacteroidia bacterium]|nr:nuclear transport factor 2 family protein [Bacteroidia bacterium]
MNQPLSRFVLIFFLLFAGGTSFAQTAVTTDEAKLNELLTSFVDSYQSLTQTKNKQAVLQYFHPEATSNIYVFNISGKSRVSNGNVRGFEAYLDNLLRSPNLVNVYELVGDPMVNVSGEVATITYKIKYEIKEEDGIWVKGNELVTLALEKTGDKWLIVHYNIVQIEDEKLKGTCVCELFVGEGDDAEVVSKTTVPNGRSYSTKFDNFVFRTAENGDWVIKSPTQTFKRLSTGKLVKVSEEGDSIELGIPSSKKETVLMILSEGIYKESCARITVR